MKYLKPGSEIIAAELDELERSLHGFYSNTPPAYHAGSFAANEDWADAGHDLHRRIVSRAFSGASVIDIGSGSAASAPYFRAAGAQYTGVDLSVTQIADAKVRFPWASFLAGDWRRVKDMGPSFDMAVSFFVLEHMARPREFLASSAAVVKKGGLLAVLAPEYLRRGFMPSLHFFGDRAGGLRSKISRLDLPEAARTAFDKYIAYPALIRRARAASSRGGTWLINLKPLCLEARNWKSDWDAVYMVGEGEVASFIRGLGFELLELGAEIDGGRHGFCYVLARKL